MAGLARTGRILAVVLIPWMMTGCAGTGSKITSRSAVDLESQWARAQALEKEGRLSDAQQLYAELSRRDPKSSRYAHRLGVVCTMLGEHDRAEVAYARARELDPQNPELLADMGYAAFLRHNYAEAEALLRAALALSGENLRAKTNLALAVGFQGRYDESQALFREVHGQDEAEVLCNLAYVKSQRGDVAGATDLYKRALAIDPNVKKAAIALAELKSGGVKEPQVAQQKPYRKYMNENAPKPPKPRQSSTQVASATTAAAPEAQTTEAKPPQKASAETTSESGIALISRDDVQRAKTTQATWESAPPPVNSAVVHRVMPEEDEALGFEDSAPVESTAEIRKPDAGEAVADVVADDGWRIARAEEDESECCSPQWLAARSEQIAARRGQVGLMGFCPVALREEQKLVDTLPQYVAEYQSEKYQFSSAEAVAKFQSNPERYLPAAGGLDVVAVSQGTAVAIGSLEYALWFRHKLYLFLTRENMELFQAQAREFAVQQ